jgi:hypothetical protein
MSGFYFFRDTRTGQKFRTLAKPFMGQNTPYVELTEEEYRGGTAKPAADPVPKALPENDDLTAGLDYGEDGR